MAEITNNAPIYRVSKIFHPDGRCDAWEVQILVTAFDGKLWWRCLTKEPFSREHDAMKCLEALNAAEALRGDG